MKFPITFVSASSIHLGKTYSNTGVERPPHAKNLTSTEYDITPDKEGLLALERAVQLHTGAGGAFFTGRFTEQLLNESRAGKSDVRFKPQVLVVDIDNLPTKLKLTPPFGSDVLTTVVKDVRRYLPPELADVSCVAHASSSFGIKAGSISMHLFFILDHPFTANKMKLWLTQSNFDNELLAEHVELNPSALSLKFPLDRCTGENTRLIYVAAPRFESKLLKDPFLEPIDRVALVPGKRPTADLKDALDRVNPAAIDQAVADQIRSLRKASGLKAKTPKTKTEEIRKGEFREVLSNPDKVSIEVAYERPPFVYGNLNGGDSNGYYWLKDHPKYIFNFKDEPVVEMAKVAPDFYREQLQLIHQDRAGDVSEVPLVIRDRDADRYMAVLYDGTDGSLLEANPIHRGAVDDFVIQYGGVEPDLIETWTVHFDPKSNTQIDMEKRTLNTFRPTEYMRKEVEGTQSSINNSVENLAKACPSISVLLHHAIGGESREIRHFINWLAFVFNEREKTSIAWIFHGVEGTGKGLLFNKVLSPLFGRYAMSKKLNDMEDAFNGWREHALFVVFDEFRMADAKDGTRSYDKLKNMISEPYGTVRAIHSNQRDVPLYENFMFFSNSQDAMKIAASDRRFCVAEAQETPLNAICNTVHLMKAIEEELDTFAQFIRNFNYCPITARMAIDTNAKQRMRLASQSWVEDFAQAFKDGSFVWFIDHVSNTTPTNPSAAFFHQKSNQVLAKVALSLMAGEGPGLPMEVADLHIMYQYLSSDNRMTLIGFGKMLARHGIETQRARVDGLRRRFSFTTWDTSDISLAEFVTVHGTPDLQAQIPLAH